MEFLLHMTTTFFKHWTYNFSVLVIYREESSPGLTLVPTVQNSWIVWETRKMLVWRLGVEIITCTRFCLPPTFCSESSSSVIQTTCQWEGTAPAVECFLSGKTKKEAPALFSSSVMMLSWWSSHVRATESASTSEKQLRCKGWRLCN